MRWETFHDGWFIRHAEDAGLGTPVKLPHDAMLHEPRTAVAEGGLNAGWFEGRDYVYTKTFIVSEAELTRHHVLEFEGVYRKAEVYVNGRRVAFRPYGYTNFYVELDDSLRRGENQIEVIARNADQPNCRWYSGAGIYRPVKLWSSPKTYIVPNGVKIRTVSIQPAAVAVAVKTSAPGKVHVQILDGENLVAEAHGTGEFRLEIPNAGLWSVESPKLYTARVTFGEDVSEETFGIRSLSWGEDGLKMNGRRIILRGACIHHDNGLLGAVCHPDAVERKLRILKENGYNAIRSAHNPCSKTALAVCDRIGMLVMDEYIDHWYIHKTKYDYVEFFDEFWKQDLADMVDKDFNHPCVIMYSIGNEVAETAQPKGITLAEEMTNLLHGLDDSRPVTCGINIFFNFLNSIGLGQYSDERAEKEAARAARAKASGRRPKEKSTGDCHGNENNINRVHQVGQDADGIADIAGLGADKLPAEIGNAPVEDITDQSHQKRHCEQGGGIYRSPDGVVPEFSLFFKGHCQRSFLMTTFRNTLIIIMNRNSTRPMENSASRCSDPTGA